MKRITVSLSALFIFSVLFSLTSCNKEETFNGTQFRASMEDCTSQNGKTTLSGTALNWVSGDLIAVYGTVGCGIYSSTPQDPATTAIFNNVSGETGDPTFRAFYPTTLTTDGVNVTLPAMQTYVENSIHEFPMYAESSSNTLSFKNLCGALKLHLTANVNISSIAVTAANEINGIFSVDYNNGSPQLVHLTSGSATTTLTCATAQNITNGKDFFIYLPAGDYSDLQIELNTDDGRYCVKTANTTILVTRSQYTLITLGESSLNFVEHLYEGALPGLFTINADGDQVWFSKGNLQYQASTDTWRFAEHQHDHIGSANNNIGRNTYTGWIDLFGWGTGNNPTLATTTNGDYSTFVDWGVNSISNGGNESNVWRTLTIAEWSYLFNTRTNTTNLSTPNARYAKGRVNNTPGVIVFPDGYEHPENVDLPIGINNTGRSGWDENNYTLAQWAEMENSGAVFLPAASYRWDDDTYYYPADGNGSFSGCYQSCTPNGYSNNYYIYFAATDMFTNEEYYRFIGKSVRLVLDYD